MVMLGAYLTLTDVVSVDTMRAVLAATLTGKKAALLPLNEQALHRGADLARAGSGL